METKSEIDLQDIFKLLGSDQSHDPQKLRELKSAFISSFNSAWQKGDATLKQKMIRFAGELDPQAGLRLILIGIKENLYNVREEAVKALEKIIHDIIAGDLQSQTKDLAIRAAVVSFELYKELKQTRNQNLASLFIKSLLKIGGKNSSLAWSFFTQNTIPSTIITDIVKKFPPLLRLEFAQQYAIDSVQTRNSHASLARLLLKDIADRRILIGRLGKGSNQDVLLNSAFYELCRRIRIVETVIDQELKSNRQKDKIKGLEIVGLLGKKPDYYQCIPFLSKTELPSVRIACLKLFADGKCMGDSTIISAVQKLLYDEDETIRCRALHTLILLKAQGLDKAVSSIIQNSPTAIAMLYDDLSDLDSLDITTIICALPHEEAKKARSAIAHSIIRHDHQKLFLFLRQYAKGSDPDVSKQAAQILEHIDSIKQKKSLELEQDDAPPTPAIIKDKKTFFERISGRKAQKGLDQLIVDGKLDKADFKGEAISDLDLSGVQLNSIDFEGAIISNLNLARARLVSVSFYGAFLDNIILDNAECHSVSFEGAVMRKVSAKGALFSLCDFNSSWIYYSSFTSATLKDSSFISARLKMTDLSNTNLQQAWFVGAQLSKTSLRRALIRSSDFSLVKAYDCNIDQIDSSGVMFDQSNLESQSEWFSDITLPEVFFNEAPLKCGGFNLIVLAHEMERRRKSFLAFNRKRIELALDAFQPEQRDLLSLIPFIVHTRLELLPIDNPIQNVPSGVFGYNPSPEILLLAKKYFIIEESKEIETDGASIEALFTIGSTGTIAQSAASDIDCWICIDSKKFNKEQITALEAKLKAIEEWAEQTFHVPVHFFIVDPKNVREDRFGTSDQESSGSAQGKILKEEFYRTFIHLAGKIPFWCVLPQGLKERHYLNALSLAMHFHNDYLNLGAITTIPKEEYFGASIWQLFKGIKSPYKSVMKMSLLEKYIQTGDESGLLCDRLKTAWSANRRDLSSIDPYILLFSDVLKCYQQNRQEKIVQLLQICFFLKLGIKSLSELDSSVFGEKKELLQEYMDSWGWDDSTINDLGSFKEWTFEKILQLSNQINTYMIETYKRLSRVLQETTAGETIITPEDLTILGRKMFVHFGKQPYKVEKLPLVTHGKALFQQLVFRYTEPKPPCFSPWSLHHVIKQRDKERGTGDLLKKGSIEEIIIWLVYNRLYNPKVAFQLMPNPTHVSLQDIVNLLKALSVFFTLDEFPEAHPQALLKQADVDRLFITANFNLDKSLPDFYEYTAFYSTSWGEIFSRSFSSTSGIPSIEKVISMAESQIDIPMSIDKKVGYYVPSREKRRG
ncbi:MAG: class I adenylate cyclase [Pseudomonadota bacterium]